MENPDATKNALNDVKATIQTALASGDDNAIADAMVALGGQIQQNIIAEANSMTRAALNDREILVSRGVNPLTATETKYYNEIIAGNSFDGVETIPPPSVINRIFEELTENHDLLKCINFRPASATTEFLIKVGTVPLAYWDKLSAEVKELLDEGFTKVRMSLFKLSCFIPVSKSMLLLGPEWLDRYVREILSESMALGLENAIVAGDGKNCPIGMIKDLNDGNHPNKPATAITDLEPVTLGTRIMSPLTRDGKRSVNGVVMVVNPQDYWEKIFGATTYLNNMGQYVYNILPIPGRFVQSTAMPKGLMCAGMAKDYFMGVGFTQGIGFSDEYRYIEDERVYMTKLAGNGRPLDEDSFINLDISGLTPSLKTK